MNTLLRPRFALTLFFVLLAGQNTAHAQHYYEVVDMGSLPGQTASSSGSINNNGVVVGTYTLSFFNLNLNRAFVYKNCAMNDLGTLGGTEASATGVNDQNEIVGWARRADGTQRAFHYASGVMSDLGGSTFLSERAAAISNGLFKIPVGLQGGTSGVWYFGGTAYSIGPFIEEVTAVNEYLQATGLMRTASNSIVGGVSAGSFGPWTQIKGLPSAPKARPMGINQNQYTAGIAAGDIQDPLNNGQFVLLPPFRAFVSNDPNSPAKDLGTLGGQNSGANGINNHNWVVGWSDPAGGGAIRAFLYNGSTIIDLNTRLVNGAGWVLSDATAINDNDQIVGNGFYKGQPRAFLLLPRLYPWVVLGCSISILQ